MLERISDVLRRRKEDDKGFSLVELAVVIVVIGILVAIAVPVFMGIQNGARKAQVEAAAANGSAIVAGHIASGASGAPDFSSLNKDGITVTVANNTGANALATYCVTATGNGFQSLKGAPAACTGTTEVTGG